MPVREELQVHAGVPLPRHDPPSRGRLLEHSPANEGALERSRRRRQGTDAGHADTARDHDERGARHTATHRGRLGLACRL